MRDVDCIAFLQEVLPRLGLRWKGFRNVRRQVCRRLHRRLRELGLDSLDAYGEKLEHDPAEWAVLDALCRVTISRFWRDRGVFEALRDDLLPELATLALDRGDTELRAWSAGCASGEEPWTLALLWQLELAPRFPDLELRVVATDMDARLLERAREAVYETSSLKELPAELRARAFEPFDGNEQLRADLRSGVELRLEDVRRGAPVDRGPFDLILCRNVAFTYFDEATQCDVAGRFADALVPRGALIVGGHEHLPAGAANRFAPEPAVRGAYRRVACSGETR